MGLFSKQKIKAGETLSIYYNPRRVFLMLINDTESTIFISEDPTRIKELGIPLYPFEIIVFDKGDGDKAEGPFYVYSDQEVEIRIYEGVV